VRCAYLSNNALLYGFTLTNGCTGGGTGADHNDSLGAGVFCENNAMVSNCIITANYSFNEGGGAYQGNFYNCSFISNSVFNYGGGADNSTLINCTLTGNRQLDSDIGSGGGAYSCTLSNCTLTGNSSAVADFFANTSGGGGAAGSSILYNCELIGNASGNCGGGAFNSSLTNCMVISNSVSEWGGGTYNCALENCTLTGNNVKSGGEGGGRGSLWHIDQLHIDQKHLCIIWNWGRRGHRHPDPLQALWKFSRVWRWCGGVNAG
jgi:hypothetical protein